MAQNTVCVNPRAVVRGFKDACQGEVRRRQNPPAKAGTLDVHGQELSMELQTNDPLEIYALRRDTRVERRHSQASRYLR